MDTVSPKPSFEEGVAKLYDLLGKIGIKFETDPVIQKKRIISVLSARGLMFDLKADTKEEQEKLMNEMKEMIKPQKNTEKYKDDEYNECKKICKKFIEEYSDKKEEDWSELIDKLSSAFIRATLSTTVIPNNIVPNNRQILINLSNNALSGEAKDIELYYELVIQSCASHSDGNNFYIGHNKDMFETIYKNLPKKKGIIVAPDIIVMEKEIRNLFNLLIKSNDNITKTQTRTLLSVFNNIYSRTLEQFKSSLPIFYNNISDQNNINVKNLKEFMFNDEKVKLCLQLFFSEENIISNKIPTGMAQIIISASELANVLNIGSAQLTNEMLYNLRKDYPQNNEIKKMYQNFKDTISKIKLRKLANETSAAFENQNRKLSAELDIMHLKATTIQKNRDIINENFNLNDFLFFIDNHNNTILKTFNNISNEGTVQDFVKQLDNLGEMINYQIALEKERRAIITKARLEKSELRKLEKKENKKKVSTAQEDSDNNYQNDAVSPKNDPHTSGENIIDNDDEIYETGFDNESGTFTEVKIKNKNSDGKGVEYYDYGQKVECTEKEKIIFCLKNIDYNNVSSFTHNLLPTIMQKALQNGIIEKYCKDQSGIKIETIYGKTYPRIKICKRDNDNEKNIKSVSYLCVPMSYSGYSTIKLVLLNDTKIHPKDKSNKVSDKLRKAYLENAVYKAHCRFKAQKDKEIKLEHEAKQREEERKEKPNSRITDQKLPPLFYKGKQNEERKNLINLSKSLQKINLLNNDNNQQNRQKRRKSVGSNDNKNQFIAHFKY